MRQCMVLTTALMIGLPAPGQTIERRGFDPPKVELVENEVRLPMTFRGGRPVVEAKVNGQGPFAFFLDTGASGPVVSQKLADKLGLEPVGESLVKSGGDEPDKPGIPAKIVEFARLDLGGVKLSGVKTVAMDRVRLGGDDAPVGVLSFAMFPGCLVTLDYPRKEVRIRAGALPAPDDQSVFAYRDGRPIPSLTIAVGDEKIEAHLDSGSGGGLSLPTKLAEKLPLEGKPVETGKKARSVSGEFSVFEAKLKGKLVFGKFSYENPTIEFSDVVRRGNLGGRILDKFEITLDVKNRRFEMKREQQDGNRLSPGVAE